MWKRVLTICVFLGSTILVTGCATPARVGDMIDTAHSRASLASESLRTNIFVKSVSGGEDTNPMWTSEIGSDQFKMALEQSLAKARLLDIVREDSNYELSVRMLEVDQPWGGIDMTVTATISYQLIDRTNNRVVYDRTISRPYTAEFSDALLGFERLRKANEGAARENIRNFVDDMYDLEI